MKLLFDQNLSWRLVNVVSHAFPGSAPKVPWLQAANKPTWQIAKLLEDHLPAIRDFASSQEASMIIRQLP
ncbi:MAG: hypothetical protein JW820_03810 [Spirochaetales bacterium]|nr:hypothetical protein [Spirochaetales bacterium]